MRTRLALVACKGPHTTPWMQVQGVEHSIRILHMLPGERVVIEVGEDAQPYDSPGVYPFNPGSNFRITKERPLDLDGSPTMVEVIYG